MKHFTISIPLFQSSIPFNTISIKNVKYDMNSQKLVIEGILNETSKRNMLVESIDNGKTRTCRDG